VHVLDAGIQAEAAGGWHVVRGVSGEEDATVTIALGDLRRGHPGNGAEDLDVEVGHAGRLPHDGGATLRHVALSPGCSTKYSAAGRSATHGVRSARKSTLMLR